MNETLWLLTWLYNVYMSPFGQITPPRFSGGPGYLTALEEQGFIEQYHDGIFITHKGRKHLQRNVHILMDHWYEVEREDLEILRLAKEKEVQILAEQAIANES